MIPQNRATHDETPETGAEFPTRDLLSEKRIGGMPLDINAQQLGLEFGSGALIGAIIGFAAKKVAKVVAILVGLELAMFKFLESRGIISVDWERMSAGLVKASADAANGAPPSWLQTLLSTLSISAGFTGGFLLGFRKG